MLELPKLKMKATTILSTEFSDASATESLILHLNEYLRLKYSVDSYLYEKMLTFVKDWLALKVKFINSLVSRRHGQWDYTSIRYRMRALQNPITAMFKCRYNDHVLQTIIHDLKFFKLRVKGFSQFRCNQIPLFRYQLIQNSGLI